MAKNKKKTKIISKFERNFSFSFKRLLIFLLLVIAIGSTYFVKVPIENFVADLLNINISNSDHGVSELGSSIVDGDLEVHFIDVGQGDSIAIRFPDDKTMLIDAGDASAHYTLIPYLNTVFFRDDPDKEFDYALVTHSHEDHCGSMDEIYEEFQINYSIRPYEYSTESSYEKSTNEYNAREQTTKTYARYIDAVENENDYADDRDILYAKAGIKIMSDDPTKPYLVEFLTPNEKIYTNPNDYSPIVLLEYKGKSILFTGDAAEEQVNELEMLMNNIELKQRLSRITIYKAMHHGSSLEDSNRLSLLQKLNPEYVVIQVGEGNKYNHPHQEFLDVLGAVNVDPVKIYRNDLNKNIVFGVSTINSSLAIISDVEVDPNASASSSSNPEVLIYYSWWLIAGTLVFLFAVLCFYNYGYKKRNKKARTYENGE